LLCSSGSPATTATPRIETWSLRVASSDTLSFRVLRIDLPWERNVFPDTTSQIHDDATGASALPLGHNTGPDYEIVGDLPFVFLARFTSFLAFEVDVITITKHRLESLKQIPW
jgi:hypothetical protein